MSYAVASSDVCSIQWLQSNGTKYAPSATANTITLTDVNGLDGVKLKYQGKTTMYTYGSFVDLKNGKLGIHYVANDGSDFDRFNDGDFFIWKNNAPILKARCPRIEIGKKQ